MSRRKDVTISELVFLGTVAGLGGAWAMSQFTKMWNSLLHPGSYVNSLPLPPVPYSNQEWESTSGIAQVIGSVTLRRRLSLKEKRIGARVVHYGVGASSGVFYALLVQRGSAIATRSGVFFGFGLWLIADELLMPCLGISRELRYYSSQAQANSLGEHLAYAFTTDFVCRCLSARRFAVFRWLRVLGGTMKPRVFEFFWRNRRLAARVHE